MAKKRYNKVIIKKIAQKTRAENSTEQVLTQDGNTMEQIANAVGLNDPQTVDSPQTVLSLNAPSTHEIKPPKTKVRKTKVVDEVSREKTPEELLAMDTVSFELELSNKNYQLDNMTTEANDETKRSLRQRILDWRRKNAPPRRLMGADDDDIPFAWKNPLIVSPKGTYTSRLIKQLNKENNSFVSDKLPSKTE